MTGAAGATLTTAVEELAEAVTALRSDLASRTRRLWRWVGGIAVVGVAALVFVIATLFQAIDELGNEVRADCAFKRDVSGIYLAVSDPGPAAATLSWDAYDAYVGKRCDRQLGPLAPPEVARP